MLILEVTSERNKADENRMLLQAACLVRLGNAVCKSPEHVVKAIYVDDNYNATEYTLFQEGKVAIPFIAG